jgi:type II secretory pathway component PulK
MRRRDERGVAMLMVLVLAVALFLLLSVAIQANFAWRRHNRRELLILQRQASGLAVKPSAADAQEAGE